MKTLKKLFVLGLAVVMCLTAMSVTAFADTAFQPNVSLTRRYSNSGNEIYIGVVTDVACGAMKATLTFTEGATFVEAKSKFAESAAKAEMYDTEGNTLTFVAATDKLSGDTLGDKCWAELCFSFGSLKEINFALDDISVCDVNETLATGEIKVDSKKITIANVMNSLGSQYRSTTPALRFGAKLFRNENTNAIEGGTAVSCGYVMAYTQTLNGTALGATIDTDTGVVTVNDETKMIIKESSKYLDKTNEYLIYSVAVTFASGSANVSKEIQVIPYVKYVDANGKYHLECGNIIKNSYNSVKGISEIVNNAG